MTPEEYKSLSAVTATIQTISVSDLTSHAPRTLLWGYTCIRSSFHVYILKRKLHLFVYGPHFDQEPYYMSGTELPLEGIVPDKRLYPECCDYLFCRRLMERGVHLPFTTWDHDRPEKQFYGELYQGSPDLPAIPEEAKMIPKRSSR